MSLPRWMRIAVGFFALSGCGLFILAEFYPWTAHHLDFLMKLATIFTLAAVLAYVYYTYELTREALTASASLTLDPVPGDPFHLLCIVINHSKRSIQCWCRLNATVYGQSVNLGGFYSAEHPFEAAPFGAMRGQFRIDDLLAKANRTLAQVRAETPEPGMKDRLRLRVELWYHAHGSTVEVKNPPQPYYFDFKRLSLVFDV